MWRRARHQLEESQFSKDEKQGSTEPYSTSLPLQDPQATWDMFRQFRKRKDMAHIRYSVVIRRVKALQELDYLMKVGERKTRPGSETALYQLLPRAELAVVLDQTNLNKFIKEADYHRILSALEAFKHPKQ